MMWCEHMINNPSHIPAAVSCRSDLTQERCRLRRSMMEMNIPMVKIMISQYYKHWELFRRGAIPRRQRHSRIRRAHVRRTESCIQVKYLKCSLHPHNDSIFRIFDEIGDGFISVEKFKFILKEIDEDFTDEELEEVILEVSILSYLEILVQNFIN